MKNLLLIDGQKASLNEERFFDFHGNSVFTTLRSQNKELLYWSLHWQRIISHAEYFGFKIPLEDEVLNLINYHLTKFDFDMKVRVIVAKEHYAITIEKLEAIDPSIYHGVSVITSSYIVHPTLRYFKTGNSLPYLMAIKEAHENNAFEAILLDHEGFLADGSRSSILLYDKNKFIEVTGGLDSVMRRVILNFLSAKKITVEKQKIHPKNIPGQMLLCNSIFGLVPVGMPCDDLIKSLVERFRPPNII